MEVRQLRYFVAVAEELHFGRAAKRLHVTQPPLSQAIKQLEAEVGTPLLERTSRRVALTDAGRAFLPEARQVLAALDRSTAAAREAAEGRIGTLRLGVVPTAARAVLPALLRRYRERAPRVRLDVHELGTARQLGLLREGRLDAGIGRDVGVDEPGVTAAVLLREPLVAVRPLGVGRPAGRVALTDLAELPLVGVTAHGSPRLHHLVTAAFAGVGAHPRVVQEVDQLDTVLALVAAGVGAALLPRSAVDPARSDVHVAAVRPATTTRLVLLRGVDDTRPVLAPLEEVVAELSGPTTPDRGAGRAVRTAGV